MLIVWECCMVGKGRWDRDGLLDAIEEWLLSEDRFRQLKMRPAPPAQP